MVTKKPPRKRPSKGSSKLSNNLSPNQVWEAVRHLILAAWRYEIYLSQTVSLDATELLGKAPERHKAALKRISMAISEFHTAEEGPALLPLVIAVAQPVLESIYARVKSGELTVESSKDTIVTGVRAVLRPVLTDSHWALETSRMINFLVKTPSQITVRKSGTPNDPDDRGGNITGPALVATNALGGLLKVNYRPALQSRRKELKMAFSHFAGDPQPKQGLTDLPYGEIARALQCSFGISKERVQAAMLALG